VESFLLARLRRLEGEVDELVERADRLIERVELLDPQPRLTLVRPEDREQKGEAAHAPSVLTPCKGRRARPLLPHRQRERLAELPLGALRA
jgi:hypothetical protein